MMSCDGYLMVMSCHLMVMSCRCVPTGSADGGALKNAQFGPGSGHIWLDEVQCNGSEYFLQQCQHDSFGVNNCAHDEDAGVICQRKTSF